MSTLRLFGPARAPLLALFFLSTALFGASCDPEAPSLPPGWTCSAADFASGATNACDCGCGAFDPDCYTDPTCAEIHCGPGTVLSDDNITCEEVPTDVSPSLDGGGEADAGAETDGGTDVGTDAGAPGPCGPEPCTWTFLIYMAADNNLEQAAIADLAEMLAAPADDGIHVVVQVDRASGFYELGVGNVAAWESMKRFEVHGDQLVEVADLGEQNTGDPETLEEFVSWGLQSYPADRTMLIMWNHGNAWQGYGGDDSDDHDRLSQAEIGQAISDGMASAGETELDIIGFDACLMSTLDTAIVMRDFTRYYVASEEVEPGHGWDYTAILSWLKDNRDAEVPELGAEIVEAFYQHARDNQKHRYVTLNLMDLEKLASVESAFGSFLDDLSTSLNDEKTSLASARNIALSYGRHPDPAHDFHMIDLGHLVDEFASQSAAFAAHRDAIQQTLGQLILKGRYGEQKEQSTGLSLYFPPQELFYLSGYNTLATATDWRDFLQDFYELAGTATGAPGLEDNVADGASASSHGIMAAPSCNETAGPQAEAKLGSGEGTKVSGASSLGGLVDERTGEVEVFSRSSAALDEAGGTVTGTWDRKVLVANQGARQAMLFSETKPVPGDSRYRTALVPLTYTEPLDCPCATKGSPGFSDVDHDNVPDCADGDVDQDGVPDKGVATPDNCPWVPNDDQQDGDNDGTGDACEAGASAPVLSCTPPPSGSYGELETAFWIVTLDLLHNEAVDASLFVSGNTGIAELTPTPGALLWPRTLRISVTGEAQWQTLRPLPFNIQQPVQFRYSDIDAIYVLNEAGEPALDDDGQPASQLAAAGYGSPYVGVEVSDFAGNAASAATLNDFEGCTAPEPELCPAGQRPDCDGACFDSSLFFANDQCDDGSFGPDLFCKLHAWDFGDCEAPACPGNLDLTTDCSGRCTTAATKLGNGTCNPAFNCVELGYDQGDCPCGDSCSGNGSCVDESCACEGGYSGTYCEIPPSCGDGTCSAPAGERCSTCPSDCGACVVPCGDGVCQPGVGESCDTCETDCGTCACGDGVCGSDELCSTCPSDCGECPQCGDFVCQRWDSSAPFPESMGESCGVCPGDCGSCQGDCCVADSESGEQLSGGGCGEPAIAQCVCSAKSECCIQGWSESCKEYAVLNCGLACEACPQGLGGDVDGDGLCGFADNCPMVVNVGQADGDGDGVGDACDNCVGTPNPLQTDVNKNQRGDVCEARVSCAAHKKVGASVNGLYFVDRGAGPVQVYCDMTTDGGGWMLMSKLSQHESIATLPQATYDAYFSNALWIEGASERLPQSPTPAYDAHHVESVDWRSFLDNGQRYDLRQTFFKGAGNSRFDVGYGFTYRGHVAQDDTVPADQRGWSLTDREVYADTTGISWDAPTYERPLFWLPPRSGTTAPILSACNGFEDAATFCDVANNPRRWGSAGIIGELEDVNDPAAAWAPNPAANGDLVFVHQAPSVYGATGAPMTLLYWSRPLCGADGVSPDSDGDGVRDACDNCLGTPNSTQLDGDTDGIGDACDFCPAFPDEMNVDSDRDGIGDGCDDCLFDADNDVDGDGFCADVDNCPSQANGFQQDSDGDGVGDACLPLLTAAWWDFEGGSVCPAADVSGNGHTATCHGTVDVVEAQSYVPGFDAINLYGDGWLTSSGVNAFQGPFTASLWFSGFPGATSTLMSATNAGSPGFSIEVVSSSGNPELSRVVVRYSGAPGSPAMTEVQSLEGPFLDGFVHHVAVVKDTNELRLYVNGYLEGVAIDGSFVSGPLDVTLGRARPGSAGGEHTGVLDDVRLYPEALSVAGVMRLNYGAPQVAGDESSGVDAGPDPVDAGPVDGGVDAGPVDGGPVDGGVVGGGVNLNTNWAYAWGDTNDDLPVGSGELMDVAVDELGNVYAVATFGTDITVGGASYSVDRFGGVVVAMDYTGALMWSVPFGTTTGTPSAGDHVPRRIEVEPVTGDLIVAAAGWGPNAMVGGIDIGTQNNNATASVVRLSAVDGSLVWGQTYNTNTGASFIRALAFDAAGNVVVGGEYVTSLDFGASSMAGGDGTWDMFVGTIDVGTGAPISAASVSPGSSQQSLQGLDVLVGGDYAIGGYYQTADLVLGGTTLTYNAAGPPNGFYARVTPAGAVVHAGALNTAVNDQRVLDVRSGPSGDYYIAGRYDTSTTVGAVTLTGGSASAMLARISSATGSPVWVTGHEVEGGGFHGLQRIEVDANELVWGATHMGTAGAATFAGTLVPTSANSLVAFVVDGVTGAAQHFRAIDSAGTALRINGIAVNSFGDAAIVGSHGAAASVDGVAIPHTGGAGWDHYVLTLGNFAGGGGGGGFCTVDGFCDVGTGEDAISCPNDCYCGDATCDGTEDPITCEVDCGGGGGGGSCFIDGFCDVMGGEDSIGCPNDCYCGDAICDGTEDPMVCEVDCGVGGGGGGACFIDGICDVLGGEDSFECPNDCFCGDAVCDPAEDNTTCPADCF